ncbi:MAG: hypothetical protein HZA61_08415 [Candidatus Eisenbacteria bacterium]|uniref:N-acetyltransferase domain-containing protein n=1 Tax=Eiseniibacteriota bacterium TaxID=2212470 RepID=A0A933W904_UNCEI|nr:hypothetical protein [Candidatus Eisenbacteria bacterium]
MKALVELARVLEAIEASAWRDVWAAAPESVRASLGLRTVEREGALVIAADHIESLLMNRVLGGGLQGSLDTRTLDAIEKFFAGRQPYAINLSPLARPDGVTGALMDRGLATYFHHVKWARDSSPYTPARATDLRIAPVDAALAPAWAELSADAFVHGAEGGAAWLASLHGRRGWRMFVALDGAQVVAGGALFTHGSCGWLGMGITRDSHRARGAQSALLAARIAAAHAAKARWLTTETAPNWEDLNPVSWRNVERAGFGVIYDRPSWIRPPGLPPAAKPAG